MQMKTSIYFALIIALVMNSFMAISAVDHQSNLEQKIGNFNQRKIFFERNCMTKDGEVHSIIEDNDGNRIDCLFEAKALKGLDKELSGSSVSADSTQIPGGSCQYQADSNSDEFDKLSKETLDAANSMSCTKDEAQTEEKSCLKDVGCNALRSVMSFTGISVIRNALKNDKSSQNSCTDSNKSDCLTELVAGILKDIWSNVEGVWDLAKMGAGWAKDKAVSSWKYFTHAEDKTSDSALLASQQSESWIKNFIKHPLDSLKKMGEGLYNMVAGAIKDSFMCAKWEGQPHLSKCLAPQTQAWSCATCDQKINSICGVAGFAAGEIAVAYLTGGALNLGKAATKTVGVGRALSKISETLPKFSKLKKLSKVTSLKISKISDATMSAINKALRNKVVEGAVGAVKVVSWPLTEYAKLMDKALELGLKHGEFASEKLGVKGVGTLDYASKEMYQAAASKSGKEISSDKDAILKLSSNLSDEQRVEAASTLVGRKLTQAEEKAILKAHEVGADTGHGYGTYTQAELKEKLKILKASGIDGEEANKLMRTGLTGNEDIERMKQMISDGVPREKIQEMMAKERSQASLVKEENIDLDFSNFGISPAKKEPIIHSGIIKEHSKIKIDGDEVVIGQELGRGSAGVVYSSGNNEIVKLPLDPRNVKDLHLEVQNVEKLSEAGIQGVPILNIPKDGSMPNYLRKPKLSRMDDLDGEAIKHMNTGEYAGRYTPEQERSLRSIYNKMEAYNKGKPENAQLVLDLNPANLYWDQSKKQFIVIEGAPPAGGIQVSKYWIGPSGRQHFEDRYGISLKENP